MVPAAFVLLERLPLTPNGKIDRRALPALDPAQLSSDPALAMPRSPVEELLAQVWATVLRVERVGIYDNFFALGGHSLLATQLLAHVRQSLQVELPLRALFDAPTVAGMAAYLAQADDMAPASPPLVARMHATPPPLSFAQQRLWFLDQLDPGGTMYLIPVAIRMRGALDVWALFASLNAVVCRHEALRTTFPMLNGHPVQQIAAFQPLPPIIIDLWALPAATRERLAQQLARDKLLQPFDLTAGPLVRVRLLRLSATDHVLHVTMHHIVSTKPAWATPPGWLVSRPHCPCCRSSTPITPSGSASGFRAQFWKASSPTGVPSSPICPSWICRPTIRARLAAWHRAGGRHCACHPRYVPGWHCSAAKRGSRCS
jgi:acyl carrier protein